MDFFGLLTYLNSIGLPVPLCIILAIYTSWLIWLHRRVSALEDARYELVVKDQLKQYLRRDTFALKLKNISMENRLGEGLNSARLDQLDVRTTALERQVTKLWRIINKLYTWAKGNT